MKLTRLNIGLIALMAIAAAMAFFGHPVVSPEAIAAIGMLPFAIGDTNMGELSELLKKQGEAFVEFQRKNDERIKAIEEKGYAPADVVAKVDELNAEMNRLGKDIQEVAKKANRPQVGAEGGLSPEKEEHKSAFREKFMRKGDANGLQDLERKAFGMGSDIDGGYLIDEEMDTQIDRVATTISAFRNLAEVRTIGKTSIEMRVKTSGTAARWVGEGEAGGETTNPKYANIEIFANEMEIEPWAYNSALEDSDYDVVGDLVTEAGIGFGEGEAAAFISGNGVKRPRGILAYDTITNGSYAWGKVGYVPTTAAGAFAASNPADQIISLLHALKSQYRNGAALLMADTTLAVIRQFKDASGNFYLFNPDPTGKFGGLILGVPVHIDDNMPAIAANSYSIAYANFQRAYRIVDRKGVTLIRDNLTTKGTTKFNFRKRVGGGIKNFEAIKLMKFAAS